MLLSATDFIETLDNPCQGYFNYITLNNIVECFEVPPEYEFADPAFEALNNYLIRNPLQHLELDAILSAIPKNQFPEIHSTLKQIIEGTKDLYEFITNYQSVN